MRIECTIQSCAVLADEGLVGLHLDALVRGFVDNDIVSRRGAALERVQHGLAALLRCAGIYVASLLRLGAFGASEVVYAIDDNDLGVFRGQVLFQVVDIGRIDWLRVATTSGTTCETNRSARDDGGDGALGWKCSAKG